MEPTRKHMAAIIYNQTLKNVLSAYDQVTRAKLNGADLSGMDHMVLEKAPEMAAATARDHDDTQLSQALADLEKDRLDHGAHADPSWQLQAEKFMNEATERHTRVDLAARMWENNPDYSSPLHAAADALRALTR